MSGIDQDFPDNLLHAFVDGQLHGHDRERLLAAMERDPILAERVCALQRTKDWVGLAFADARATARPLPTARGLRDLRRWFGVAASVLLLATGVLLGWTIAPSQAPLESVVLRDIQAGHQKVLLHVDRSDPARFDEVLESVEALLRRYQAQGLSVEVVANAGGVDLLRADTSPYAERVARLLNEYDNLQFFACVNTLRRLEEKGITPVLIEGTRHDSTAVGHIIQRLREGWAYIRV